MSKTITAKAIITAIFAIISVRPVMAESCIASVYSVRSNHGTQTASGIRFNEHDMTAAHKNRKFGTVVKVTHRKTGKSIHVTITDRGPYIAGRCIDLTPAAARAIGMGWGLAPVTVE